MTSDVCKACGASDDLERNVVLPEARACMACGLVRVLTRETVYSDNPHVEPEVVEKMVSVKPEALAWVGEFPRRTRSGSGFLPAAARTATIEVLRAAEQEADRAPGTTLERLRAAGLPGAPPHGKLSNAVAPFLVLRGTASESTALATLLSRASYERGSLIAAIAADALATRARAFIELASAIDSFTPAMIIAAMAARPAATNDEIAALERAVQAKLDRTNPHSSDVTELRRALASLRG